MAKVEIISEFSNDSLEVSAQVGSEMPSIRTYFEKVLELSRSGEEFPVDLDDVWSIGYSRKDDAVRNLVGGYFVEDVDYQVFHKNAENPKGGRPRDIYKISVPCMEFLVARRVREVFDVYRQVFHAVANAGAARKSEMDDREYEVRKGEVEARLLEAKNESARIMLSIKERTSIPEVAAIADAYATNILVGKEVVALPEAKEKTYSATEIGKILGVSSAKIGRLSNMHNLKTEEYGKWFFDKSRHSNKEVESFRYYGKAIDVFRKLLP